MAQQNTFDIASKIDHAEVNNAVQQALKEIAQRFDFKGSKCDIQLDPKEIILTADDPYKLKSLTEILETRLVKRNVPLKGLKYGKVEPAAGDTVRQHIEIQQGIPTEKCKDIVKFIKDAKLKVQATINSDFVRVAGKDRDVLQDVIAKLKTQDFGIDMQFTNYRSN